MNIDRVFDHSNFEKLTSKKSLPNKLSFKEKGNKVQRGVREDKY